MPSLHTLQHSIDDKNWLERCLQTVQNNDAILLLEDAVSISCHLPSLKLLSELTSVSLFVLDADCQARGINPTYDAALALSASEVIDLKAYAAFKKVSYQEFVELSLSYDKVINWA